MLQVGFSSPCVFEDRRTEDLGMLDTSKLLVACNLVSVY